MYAERWQQIDQLFHLALAQKPADRESFLAKACAGDESLRSEISELVASHEQAESFIEEPASDLAAELFAEGQTALEIGQTVGPYKVLSVLGIGGMGEVYLAQDARLGRQVALKLLPAQFTINADRVRRFEWEARAASALNHPNLVTIHEIGRIDNSQFIVTEFVDGQTLRRRLTDNRPGLREALDIAIQVAAALDAAHAAGIEHRDIKPENIMLRGDGYVKVLDFGLSKLTEREGLASEATQALIKTDPGMVMGTVRYMSPEQARAQPTDTRTDIWSLGVVLYEMVAARVPFEGETPSHVLVSLMEHEPPALAQYADVPFELDRIVTKALRKNKDERYQTASDLALDLKNLKQELEVEDRLRRSLEAEVIGKQPTNQNDKQTAHETLRAHETLQALPVSTAEVRLARTSSRAEHLASEIQKHRVIAAFALASLLIAVTSVSLWMMNKRAPAAPNAALKSIAVLPLKSLSGNANDEYLGLGITDTIITRVSQIPQMSVRPTSAILKYGDRGTDALTAARELQADAVLDGTVQRVGDRLRLNLNLFRVEDGQSLWSESFNLSFNDMFSVQDQVSQRVAERLRLKLIPQELKARPSSPEAFDDYLRGKYYLYRGGRSGNDTAIEMLERAVTKDPNFAPAYAALAQAYRVRFFSFAPHEKQWQEKAFVAVEKALALDPELADAYVARATLLWTRANNFPHEQSARECQRALALNPNLDEAHRQLTVIYNHVGLLDKAIEESKKAFDPSSTALGGGALLYQGNYQQALNSGKELSTPFNHYQKAFALTHLGRRDEASAIIEDSLKKFPEDQGGALYSMRAMLFALAGDERRAGENINTALEQGKDFGHFHHATYTIAAAYAIMNKREQALKWVQFTADNGFPCYPLFEHDPDLNNLRQDPRFVAFMSRLKAQWEQYKTTFA